MKLLEISSLIFLTNFIHNAWNKEYIYAWLMLLLTATSVLVHSKLFHEDKDICSEYSLHNILLLLDKILCYSIIIYGGNLFWKTIQVKEISFIPIITFLTVVYLYLGGYFQNNYCFDPDPFLAQLSHGVLHIVSSIGHHAIMYDYSKLQWMRQLLLGLLQ